MKVLHTPREYFGDPDKPAIIFLHGYGAASRFYRDFALALSSDYFVIMPELFGLKGGKNKSFKAYLDEVILFIKEHNAEKAIVVGHSFGGFLGMHLASEILSLKHVIAINPMMVDILKPLQLLTLAQRGISDFLQMRGEIRGFFKNPMIPVEYARNMLSDPLHYLQGVADTFKVHQPVTRTNVPVTILYGNRDSMFQITDEDIEKYHTTLLKLNFISVDNYSHNWLIYYPELAANYVREILNP